MPQKNSYQTACTVEALWTAYLHGWFDERFGRGNYHFIGDEVTPGHKKIQAVCDLIAWDMFKTHLIELKVDEYETGNLFCETWSNKSTGKRGWFHTCDATELTYVFPLQRCAYVGPLPGIRSFVLKHIGAYREVEQAQYKQANDTWGALVPARHLIDAGLVERHDLSLHIPLDVVTARKQEKARKRLAGMKETRPAPVRYQGTDRNGQAFTINVSSS